MVRDKTLTIIKTKGYKMPKGIDEVEKTVEHTKNPFKPVEKAVWKERFFKVKFHGKALPTDSEDVVLSVNGETLTIQRDQPVILPERFLECARHTKRQTFIQEPGAPRKVSSPKTLFPFEVLEDGRQYTEQEYRQQRDAGNKEHLQNLARYGFDVDPSKIG